MQRFKSHKIVTAARIAAIYFPQPNSVLGALTLEGHDTEVPMPRQWYEKHQPYVDGYLVQYEDGYSSYSPAKAFEEGYHHLPSDDGVRHPVWPLRTSCEPEALVQAPAVPLIQNVELPTRVTSEALEAMLRSVTYEIRPDGRTTVCELTFKNGFSLRGESSAACIDNFKQELGEEYALKEAMDKAWGYAGFMLREDRYRAGL